MCLWDVAAIQCPQFLLATVRQCARQRAIVFCVLAHTVKPFHLAYCNPNTPRGETETRSTFNLCARWTRAHAPACASGEHYRCVKMRPLSGSGGRTVLRSLLQTHVTCCGFSSASAQRSRARAKNAVCHARRMRCTCVRTCERVCCMFVYI